MSGGDDDDVVHMDPVPSHSNPSLKAGVSRLFAVILCFALFATGWLLGVATEARGVATEAFNRFGLTKLQSLVHGKQNDQPYVDIPVRLGKMEKLLEEVASQTRPVAKRAVALQRASEELADFSRNLAPKVDAIADDVEMLHKVVFNKVVFNGTADPIETGLMALKVDAIADDVEQIYEWAYRETSNADLNTTGNLEE